MRIAAWCLFAATLPIAAFGQMIDGSYFSITDTGCTYQHDPAIERILHVVSVKVERAVAPKIGSMATMTLRNDGPRPITAILYSYSIGNPRDRFYAAEGKDLVYQITSGQPVFPPGKTFSMVIDEGRISARLEVYPCMALFDDGSGVGDPHLLKMVMTMRAATAKSFVPIMDALESALKAPAPKPDLVERAKRMRRATRSPHGNFILLDGVVGTLSGGPDAETDRHRIANALSLFRTQYEWLLMQSKPANPK